MTLDEIFEFVSSCEGWEPEMILSVCPHAMPFCIAANDVKWPLTREDFNKRWEMGRAYSWAQAVPEWLRGIEVAELTWDRLEGELSQDVMGHLLSWCLFGTGEWLDYPEKVGLNGLQWEALVGFAEKRLPWETAAWLLRCWVKVWYKSEDDGSGLAIAQAIACLEAGRILTGRDMEKALWLQITKVM